MNRPTPPQLIKSVWTDADFDEEVRWVHQQYILIVEETPRGRVIRWERATKRPPSTGACSLARWAADNRTAFYKDLLPRAMAKAKDEEEDPRVNEEEMAIERVVEVLEALKREGGQRMDEELRADVPGVLQQRVRDMLSNWGQRCGVSLADDARAHLDSAIVGLLRDSLRAFAPSSGGK